MIGLLAWEQAIVRGGDMRRIDKAFFQINSWIGMVCWSSFWWISTCYNGGAPGGPFSLGYGDRLQSISEPKLG